jgi:hypothetical protein
MPDILEWRLYCLVITTYSVPKITYQMWNCRHNLCYRFVCGKCGLGSKVRSSEQHEKRDPWRLGGGKWFDRLRYRLSGSYEYVFSFVRERALEAATYIVAFSQCGNFFVRCFDRIPFEDPEVECFECYAVTRRLYDCICALHM